MFGKIGCFGVKMGQKWIKKKLQIVLKNVFKASPMHGEQKQNIKKFGSRARDGRAFSGAAGAGFLARIADALGVTARAGRGVFGQTKVI